MVTAFSAYNVGMPNKEVELSDLMLNNVEALAYPGERVEPGSPCYSNARYDADKPQAVQCGTPCTYSPLDIPWFPSTSYCL